MDNTFELEDALAFFPKLKTVEMCECGISNEDMDAMQELLVEPDEAAPAESEGSGEQKKSY